MKPSPAKVFLDYLDDSSTVGFAVAAVGAYAIKKYLKTAGHDPRQKERAQADVYRLLEELLAES